LQEIVGIVDHHSNRNKPDTEIQVLPVFSHVGKLKRISTKEDLNVEPLLPLRLLGTVKVSVRKIISRR
jgi:hypothetical protein